MLGEIEHENLFWATNIQSDPPAEILHLLDELKNNSVPTKSKKIPIDKLIWRSLVSSQASSKPITLAP